MLASLRITEHHRSESVYHVSKFKLILKGRKYSFEGGNTNYIIFKFDGGLHCLKGGINLVTKNYLVTLQRAVPLGNDICVIVIDTIFEDFFQGDLQCGSG